MREPITLTIDGTPIAKGRPRVYRGHGVTPERTRQAEQAIRDTFNRKYPGFQPFEGRLAMTCRFWMPRNGRPDLDNLVKLVTDALNGLAYRDDEQIDTVTAYRHLPDRKVRGCNGRMRWRHTGDPLTHHGEEYTPHTAIRIEETPTERNQQ